MKLSKKLIWAVACLVSLSGATSLYASNLMIADQTVPVINQAPALTTIDLAVDDEDSHGTVLEISIVTNRSIQKVTVNGESVNCDATGGRCYYEVTSAGNYTVKVTDNEGNITTKTQYIDFQKSNAPTLSLSKKHQNSKWYLEITYSDDKRGVTSVTVNGNSIESDPVGDTVDYRVEDSGKYTVVVTDRDGNQTKKSVDFSFDDDDYSSKPKLSLSKKYTNGKYYLVIKASDEDNDIRKVTVDGDRIDFDEDGGTEEYRVTESGTYHVEVTDSADHTVSDKIYISVDDDDEAPSLSLTQTYKNNVPYMIIKASDDTRISKVTINGDEINFSSTGGTVEYRVNEGKTYEVVVKDSNGNTTKKSLYIDTKQTVGDIYTSSGQTVVFEQNSRNWYRNGVQQADMDVATCSIHSRICLPLRYVAYALNISEGDIAWDSVNKVATIVDGGNTVRVQLGSTTMYVNGSAMSMDTAPEVVNGHIMLPISQIAKAFSDKGIHINWDNAAKEVTITTN